MDDDFKPTRRERAAANRRRMLDAARARFVAQGYVATTMAQIADDAGMAVQTLYFTFNTKAALLAEVFERAVLGDDEPVPPPQQRWHRDAMAADDPHSAMHRFADGVAEIVGRVAPLRPVIDAASAEPGVEELWLRGERLREEGYRAFLAGVSERHPLREGLTLDQATDVLLVLVGPVGHRGFVEDRGWPVERWTAWLADVLARELFDHP